MTDPRVRDLVAYSLSLALGFVVVLGLWWLWEQAKANQEEKRTRKTHAPLSHVRRLG